MTVAVKSRRAPIDLDQLIVGKAPAIKATKTMVSRVAASNVPVLLQGPSGSGKEMVAKAIHALSDRAEKPFVAINCGAIPAELIESELFGHEKGSFTGANARRIGRFEEAHGGTLFLDEIGDMRFDMQVKLLRVLEEGIITRVGGTGTIPVDVRIISATHQDLDAAIAANRFREDLYFRLGVLPVQVPDLASRAEDIPLLIAHFQNTGRHNGKARFDPSALSRLMDHDWPGNVRELRNVVDRANVLFPGEVLGASEIDQLVGRTSPIALRENPFRPAFLSQAELPVAPLPTEAPAAPSFTGCPLDAYARARRRWGESRTGCRP